MKKKIRRGFFHDLRIFLKNVIFIAFPCISFFMSNFGICCRCVPVLLLLFLFLPGVSGWTLKDVSITPAQGPVAPQTPVKVSYTIYFDSWMTGTTFENDDTLDMYTDLENARWVVTLTDTEEGRPPVTTILADKKGARARFDGWTLSYTSRQLTMDVRLQGVAPNVSGAQDKIMFRVQELGPDTKAIGGTVTTRKYQVSVPTPIPTTQLRTQAPARATSPAVQNTPTATAAPTRKQTYSPGPGLLEIGGMLAVTAIIAMKKK
jgi:hypothetical protein